MPSAEKILDLPDPATAEPERGTATVARFEIRYSRFLDPNGNAVRALPDFAADRAELVALYRGMVLARTFDAKAVALQRTGRLGTFPSALGQEAVAVGIAAAILPRRARIFRSASRWALTCRTRSASPLPSSCGARRGSRSAPLATAPPRRAMSPKRSTWPAY